MQIRSNILNLQSNHLTYFESSVFMREFIESGHITQTELKYVFSPAPKEKLYVPLISLKTTGIKRLNFS